MDYGFCDNCIRDNLAIRGNESGMRRGDDAFLYRDVDN
jgi:hypothetical protein